MVVYGLRVSPLKRSEVEPSESTTTFNEDLIMLTLSIPLVLAAAEYSLIYMLLGGGFFGAIVIFFVAKMLGR